MPRNLRRGAASEDRAAAYLLELGYTIITRNYYAPGSEIDIVAMDGDTLVFIEVKNRKKGAWASPEEGVSLDKQRRLWDAAGYYVSENLGKECEMRFDVIAIEGESLRHHKDAFRPAYRCS